MDPRPDVMTGGGRAARNALGVLTAIVFLAGLVAVVVMSGATPAPAARIETATSNVEQAGSVRAELTGSTKIEAAGLSQLFQFDGEGVYDYAAQRGRSTIRLADFGELQQRSIGDTTYVMLPEQLRGFVGIATPWVAFEQPVTSQADNPFATADAGDALEALRRSIAGDDATVEQVGREEVRGEPTTHYRIVVDNPPLPDTATSVPPGASPPDLRLQMEVWIGEDDLLRRQRITATVIQSVGDRTFTTTSVTTIDLVEFGVEVGSVEPPPDDQVTVLDDPSQLAPTPPSPAPAPGP